MPSRKERVDSGDLRDWRCGLATERGWIFPATPLAHVQHDPSPARASLWYTYGGEVLKPPVKLVHVRPRAISLRGS